MSLTPEGRVKKTIKEWLADYAPDTWYYMPVQTGYGVSGIPDFVCNVPTTITEEMVGQTIGVFVGIEAKTVDGRQTPNQKDRQTEIEAASGKYVLVYGSDNVATTLTKAFRNKPMIKINDRFSIERDSYQWILFEETPSESKSGTRIKKTYHANLEQVSREIIDRRLGGCTSLEEMQRLLAGTIKIFHAYLKSKVKDNEIISS